MKVKWRFIIPPTRPLATSSAQLEEPESFIFHSEMQKRKGPEATKKKGKNHNKWLAEQCNCDKGHV